MLFRHTIRFGKLLSPDGEGGGGAGAGADDGNTGGHTQDTNDQQGAGAQGGSQNQNQQGRQPAEPSANKLIKDFASQRGITVEKLLDSYRELEDKGKTELQRMTGERDGFKTRVETAERELRTERAERIVLAAATKEKAIDPDAILALAINRLEYDDSGKPANVDNVIKALRDERPERFQAANGAGDGGQRSNQTGNNDMNAQIRRMARRNQVG